MLRRVMNLEDTPGEAEYRAAFRAWLGEHAADAPARTVLAPQTDASLAKWRAWQGVLAGGGYAGVTWPTEHGGPGLGAAERLIVDQELERADLQGVMDFVGVEMVGPTLMTCASAEQCERHLGPLLRADELWCQLFSEPGAGSDLANVATKAVAEDDGTWVVNGQKVWTSFAQHAAFGIMLARTEPDQPRHRGLSMFIVPMDTPGLTIAPLRQITGEAEFNEVFLDDVQLPADAIIGERGTGWKVALTMLGFERVAVGPGLHGVRIDRLASALNGAGEDRGTRVRFGRVAAELLGIRFWSYRIVSGIQGGSLPGPDAGLVKISTVNASLEACRVAVDATGPQALEGEWGHQVSALPGLRSAGGTEEIVRNVVGERVLGLPAEPKGGS
jgi:alkylation response protein AidB-like acyl-CoA dehydrogenase